MVNLIRGFSSVPGALPWGGEALMNTSPQQCTHTSVNLTPGYRNRNQPRVRKLHRRMDKRQRPLLTLVVRMT